MEATLQAEVPSPTKYLGPNLNGSLNWSHPDDLFVDFQILRNVVMGDPEFFQRYVNNQLLDDEKHMAAEYHPCFAETDEVVEAHMRSNMMEFGDSGMRCFMVSIFNSFGLLLVSEDECVEIIRRAVGLEVEKPSLHFKMQFMRFTDEAIAKFDLAGNVTDLYQSSYKTIPPLRVNLAKYIDPQEG